LPNVNTFVRQSHFSRLFVTMAYMTTSMHGPYTPPCKCHVHGGHVHGRVYGPCTRLLTSVRAGPVHGHTYPNTAMYTAVYGHERTGYTAVYGPCTRPCTGPVHGREQPCTRSTAVFTVRTRQCTRAVNTPVYRYTTAYTVVYPVHGRVCGPCIRPSTAMYRLCTRPCTGHAWSVHDPNTAVYEVVHGV